MMIFMRHREQRKRPLLQDPEKEAAPPPRPLMEAAPPPRPLERKRKAREKCRFPVRKRILIKPESHRFTDLKQIPEKQEGLPFTGQTQIPTESSCFRESIPQVQVCLRIPAGIMN